MFLMVLLVPDLVKEREDVLLKSLWIRAVNVNKSAF